MLELAKVWRANHPGFSARTLFYSILNQGIYLGVGINRFERWVAEAGMNVRKSRPQVPKTSDGKGKYGALIWMEHFIFASKIANSYYAYFLQNMKASKLASLKKALA
ncbi:MAG: hypothetical protein IPI15_02700 [Saprospiraceae bacterium]|uniref:hypothetical protein n=1 Tax=Candidatus Brachybacter algidus TaxID=2982024 RepID=UPI00257EE9A5|nr:hypothetical protein [Candidatus Brachybacter algidus]MBK7602491.1 hypothetical protein [Candidatus Brachybacter algidus]